MEFKKIVFDKDNFSKLTTEKEQISFLTTFITDLINTVEINYKTLLPEEIDDLFFNVISFTGKNDYKRNSTSEEIVNLTNFVKLDYMRDATKNENETLMEYFIRKRPDLLLRPIRDLLEFRVFQPENGGLIYVKNKIGYKVFLEYKRAINEMIKKETQSTQITNEISTIKNKYEFLLKLCDIAKKIDNGILNPEILDLDIESFTDNFEKECFENFSNNENKNSELHLYLTKLQIFNSFWENNIDIYNQSEDTLNNKILRHCADLFDCCFGEFEVVCFTFNIDLDKYCHDTNYFLNTTNIPRGICLIAPFNERKQSLNSANTQNLKKHKWQILIPYFVNGDLDNLYHVTKGATKMSKELIEKYNLEIEIKNIRPYIQETYYSIDKHKESLTKNLKSKKKLKKIYKYCEVENIEITYNEILQKISEYELINNSF